MKKNNKGFSLVELIVVVLIMAIIAVALAPQVMKWVENSRKSTDCNNYDSVVSAVNIAIANEDVMKTVVSADTTLTFSPTGWACANDTLTNAIKPILGDDWTTAIKVKRSEGGSFVITVKAGGTVERTTAPSSDDIS